MIRFQLVLSVAEDKQQAFESTYAETFEPALKRQKGFIAAELCRLFPAPVAEEIGALPTEYNYCVLFTFESEALRRQWATSPDHDRAWPALEALASSAGWRGFDVVRTAE